MANGVRLAYVPLLLVGIFATAILGPGLPASPPPLFRQGTSHVFIPPTDRCFHLRQLFDHFASLEYARRSCTISLKGGGLEESSQAFPESDTWKDEDWEGGGAEADGENRPSLFEAAHFETGRPVDEHEGPALPRLTEDGKLELDWEDGLSSTESFDPATGIDEDPVTGDSNWKVVTVNNVVENWAFSIAEAAKLHKALPHAEAQQCLGINIDHLYDDAALSPLPEPQFPPSPTTNPASQFHGSEADAAALSRVWELAGGRESVMCHTLTYLRNKKHGYVIELDHVQCGGFRFCGAGGQSPMWAAGTGRCCAPEDSMSRWSCPAVPEAFLAATRGRGPGEGSAAKYEFDEAACDAKHRTEEALRHGVDAGAVLVWPGSQEAGQLLQRVALGGLVLRDAPLAIKFNQARADGLAGMGEGGEPADSASDMSYPEPYYNGGWEVSFTGGVLRVKHYDNPEAELFLTEDDIVFYGSSEPSNEFRGMGFVLSGAQVLPRALSRDQTLQELLRLGIRYKRPPDLDDYGPFHAFAPDWQDRTSTPPWAVRYQTRDWPKHFAWTWGQYEHHPDKPHAQEYTRACWAADEEDEEDSSSGNPLLASFQTLDLASLGAGARPQPRRRSGTREADSESYKRHAPAEASGHDSEADSEHDDQAAGEDAGLALD